MTAPMTEPGRATDMGTEPETHTEPEAKSEPPPFMPTEYEVGGNQWFARAVNELARALHPVFDLPRREAVGELPDDARGVAGATDEEIQDGSTHHSGTGGDASGRVRDGVVDAVVDPAPPGLAPSLLHRDLIVGSVILARVTDVLDFNVDAALECVYAMADDVGTSVTQQMLAHITDVCEANDQVIHTGGDVGEAFIRAIETIEFNFDANGNHGVVMVDRDGVRTIDQMPFTSEQRQRVDAIVDRRREEWHAARRRRDLP